MSSVPSVRRVAPREEARPTAVRDGDRADNLANQKVASGVGCPSRSKHFLRRYGVLKRRIEDGEVVLKHVPDIEMAADFLTKWIPAPKLEQSLRYACNSHALHAATS